MMNRLKYSTDTARRILTVLEEFSLDKNIKFKENSSNSLLFNKDIKIENISFLNTPKDHNKF